MNMKKTIAAVSAAAVAVSAMAATVSAEETTKTYTYKLATSVIKTSVPNATFSWTIQDAVVWGTDAVTEQFASGVSSVGTPTVTLPSTSTQANTPLTASITVNNTSLNLTSDTSVTATLTDSTTPTWSYEADNGNTIAASDISITLTDSTSAAVTIAATDVGMTVKFNLTATDYYVAPQAATTTKYLNYVDFDTSAATGMTGYGDDRLLTIKINNKDTGDQLKSYVYDASSSNLNYNSNLTKSGFTFSKELNGIAEGTRLDVQFTLVVPTKEGVSDTIYSINNSYLPVISATYDDTTTATISTPVTLLGIGDSTSKSAEVVLPFETNSTDNVNIISYLNGVATNPNGDWGLDLDATTDEYDHYMNVVAVVNDAIANSTNVTFKFNTAADAISFVAQKDGWIDWWTDVFDTYDAALALSATEVGTANAKVYAIYADWRTTKNSDYTAFGQQLYDWYYIPDGTGYTGYEWTGTNLFAGALVINEGYTMSLSDTDVFDWTQTSLSFDWDSIQQNAMTNNDYANYVQSIKLATSTRWYWDSMDLIITQGDAEDAGTDAGVDGDGEELDDTDVEDEEIDFDDEEDEEPEPDVDEEPEPVVEEPVASNPTTGNASVALAVIPVALAAAAIVAKKRG